MGEMLQPAAHVSWETVVSPCMCMRSEVAYLQEDWVPPQDWRHVEFTCDAVGFPLLQEADPWRSRMPDR